MNRLPRGGEPIFGRRLGDVLLPAHLVELPLEPPVVREIAVLRTLWSGDSEELDAIARGEWVPTAWQDCEADVRMVARGFPVADVIEERKDLVSDLMEELTRPLEQRRVCKIEGCGEPWLTQKGMYGRLCEEHAAEKKAEFHERRNGDGNGNGLNKRGEPRGPLHLIRASEVEPERPDGELAEAARAVEAARGRRNTAQLNLDKALSHLRGLVEAEMEKEVSK